METTPANRTVGATSVQNVSARIAIKPKREEDAAPGFTVVKRTGRLVPFRKDRIVHAIEAAFREQNQIQALEPLPREVHGAVHQVSEAVVEDALARARAGACLTVEGIQDLVEVKLMECGHYEIARCYIAYRNDRKAHREDSALNLKLLRRDGVTLVRFNPVKIASAIERAFRASLGIDGTTPGDVIEAVDLLTNKVIVRCKKLSLEGTTLHIELIQDEVERAMMSEGYYQVAKDFILYRAEHARRRSQKEVEDTLRGDDVSSEQTVDEGRLIAVTEIDGTSGTVRESELRRRVEHACRGVDGGVGEAVLEEALRNFYDGIRRPEVDQALILAARVKIEHEPNYTFVAARLLLDKIYRETVGIGLDNAALESAHREYFKQYLDHAISIERLSPDLRAFDLDKIAGALCLERDKEFQYMGIQTLYDRYLIHEAEVRLETPQIFWMRVAMGLSLNEGDQKTDRAIEFYDVLSQMLFTSSTPTLFNSGTMHSQMSSCYLSTVMDDLQHIFKVVSDDAQLSKWAGGLGNDWTNVRATGSWIKGTNGKSQGVIPFLKVANDTAVAVNQGGKRKGAMCAYLETWHLDIEDFLELRKNTGDERRRTHDMNTANWIPDLFMKRVVANQMWTLFSPSDVPDLHDLYGKAFEQRYAEYEQKVERGELKLFKKAEAVALWRKMLSMLFETGHPWITFKDPSNVRSPQDHVGVVHSSNLCTEILLNTSREETAVCNLGSLNLARHVTRSGIDRDLLSKTIRTAVRMLDNVIDLNYYPTLEAKNANLRHRPVGLGIMGFQDALYAQSISYASTEAVAFSDESMELVSYYALLASSELAKERGTYPSFKGSKWDRGLLPYDTIAVLRSERGDYLDVDASSKLDWTAVRESIRKHGMRNSNTMAIAPTATISNITGVAQSIEPTYKHLFSKSNLSGDFIVHNSYLVEDLKRRGLWDADMVDDLKYFDGSLGEIERIPADLKQVYLTAFEIEPEWIVECASRRQKWIDMGQSLNLYICQPNGKKLHQMYVMAWEKGLKTTYYLRSVGATQVEKSTTDINKRGLQPRWMKNKSASADIEVTRTKGDPDTVMVSMDARVEVSDASTVTAMVEASASPAIPTAACNLDGDCESCQ